MSDSDSDEVPCLVAATGSAGAKSGMTNYEIQQASAANVAKGGGVPGVDWKVPVSIVTGFLGSGKSTLVQYILHEQKEKKIAVMVNEFGDSADIERAMRVAKDGEEEDDWIEMNNGCMCCKFKDKAVEALENLVKRKGRFDHIVIETSGLADPEPLIAMFWQDLEVESPLMLNGVVTLVDAKHILSHLGKASKKGFLHARVVPEDDTDAMDVDEPEKDEDGGFIEASQQISLADAILVNKVDLVDAGMLQEVKKVMLQISPDAKVEECSFSKVVDVDALLSLPGNNWGKKGWGETTAQVVVPNATSTSVSGPSSHDHECGGDACNHEAHSGKHTSDIGSVTVESQSPMPRAALDVLMKQMLWDIREDAQSDTTNAKPVVLRLKAIVHFKDAPPVMVQAVGELYDITNLTTAPLPFTRVVVIGRNLQRANWQQMLDSFTQ